MSNNGDGDEHVVEGDEMYDHGNHDYDYDVPILVVEVVHVAGSGSNLCTVLGQAVPKGNEMARSSSSSIIRYCII